MFFGNFTPDNNNWLVLGKLATRSKISHLLLTGILKIKKETALPFRSTPSKASNLLADFYCDKKLATFRRKCYHGGKQET